MRKAINVNGYTMPGASRLKSRARAWRRAVSALLCLVLLLSTTTTAFATDGGAPSPDVTTQSEVTPSPEATEQPAVTPPPEATEQPAVTPPPEATEQPAVTPPPEVTEQPAVTPPPEVTEQPTVTPPPEATDEPEQVTPTPETTDEPEEAVYTLYLTHVFSFMEGSVSKSVQTIETLTFTAAEFVDGVLDISSRALNYAHAAAEPPSPLAIESFNGEHEAAVTITYTVEKGWAVKIGANGEAEFEKLSISGWKWMVGGNALSDYDGQWYLNQPAGDINALTEKQFDELLDNLEDNLPKRVLVTLSNGDSVGIDLTWPSLKREWPLRDYDAVTAETADKILRAPVAEDELYRFDAVLGEEYPLEEGVLSPCLFISFGAAETHGITEWALTLTKSGPKEDWTDEQLIEALPAKMVVRGTDGEDSVVKLAWTRSVFEKAEETRFDAAQIKEDVTAPDEVLLPSVFFIFTEPEDDTKYISGWEWIEKEDFEGLLIEMDGQWYLSLGGAELSAGELEEAMPEDNGQTYAPEEPAEVLPGDSTRTDSLEELEEVLPGNGMQTDSLEELEATLEEMLPHEIRAVLSNGKAAADDEASADDALAAGEDTQLNADATPTDGDTKLNADSAAAGADAAGGETTAYADAAAGETAAGADAADSEDTQPESTAILPITWDYSALSEEPQIISIPAELSAVGEGKDVMALDYDEEPLEADAEEQWEVYPLKAVLEEGYALAEDAAPLEILLSLGGTATYANYPGNREIFGSAAELEQALAAHQVQGLTPEGTTVNLFDYVASKDGSVVSDLTDKISHTGGSVATSAQWNLGINQNRLLLFGDSIIGAGYWNNGAGAGRQWAQDNTNMKGIVLPTLTNGYPVINRSAANQPIANAGSYTENQLPFCIAWAADENSSVSPQDAPALSQRVLNNCGDDSLAYLFDTGAGAGKRVYKDIDGLFQIDSDGYYYYDARKNFAELSGDSFILYDGPAIWRTDGGWDGSGFNGDKSLGNFYPFNTGRQVFDCLDTDRNCLSSSESTSDTDQGLDGSKWSKGLLKNKATGEDVVINHHMGMTVEIKFSQPESGKLNMGVNGRQPMVFQFSGDDDVWIFIDDVLVLDLGGIHSELYGTIDFSTGTVITGQSWRTGGLPGNPGGNPGDASTSLYQMFVNALGTDAANASGWTTGEAGGQIFRTGTEHTLKLFYLERGNYDSSLQLRFNLQPSLYHSIKKVDQNGDPLPGVTFELYAATPNNGASTDADDYTMGEHIGTMTTGADGKTSFTRTDGSPFSFADMYHRSGKLYYILKETSTAGGYRSLPEDIILRFDPDNSMLVVVNRYQTGAYASFFSNIKETGTLTYGQFDTGSGVIAPSGNELPQGSKEHGIIVAVPMLYESNSGKWQALYGSNTEGYGAVVPEERTAEAWRTAVLKAALYQASDTRWPEWRLTYNSETGKLEGLLEDLPGRSDRYALNNPSGDMKMVYGVIHPSALQSLGITGSSSAELYDSLEAYVSSSVAGGASAEAAIDAITSSIGISGDFDSRGFSFLNTDQFQREFRSTIYIPNERRELRIQKIDEDGRGINGVEFTLTPSDGSYQTVTGTTATVDGQDGMLIFRPDGTGPGYARAEWGEVNSKYILTETHVPEGYERNEAEIPVVVGIYSIYADAGTKEDGVTVMADVGKLMQTMTKYAADDMVNITLRDITAIAQTQESGKFDLYGWKDDLLEGTQIPRSMNLHYGVNAVVDYGLHDEDGGKNIYPFFTTDEGFLRTRVEQNTDALENPIYEGSVNTANWDNLRGIHITSLFSLQNTVVVTNKKTVTEDTGKLRISKTVSGDNLTDSDYTNNFSFTVSLKNADGSALPDEYYYYGEQRAGYIRDGGTLSLRHDEALTVLGLPDGTVWEIAEEPESGWSVSPISGVIKGSVKQGETVSAAFTNYKGDLPKGGLTVSKTVIGNVVNNDKAFRFTVRLDEPTVNGAFGDMTFVNGVAIFTLKHNESKTASGLPVGVRYTVEEDNYTDEGYTTTKQGETGTIPSNATAAASFTNTKSVHGLTVKKLVDGEGADGSKDFRFTVTLSDATISKTFGEMSFTNGVASFTLKHNESKTAIGLPAGTGYTVTEDNYSGDGYATTVPDNAAGSILDRDIEVTFINTRTLTSTTGNLIISKTVTGSSGETARDFHFTVTLADKSISGAYGDMSFTDGAASFTLRHGESKSAVGLPAGVGYTVTETEANTDGYATTSVNATGTIRGNTVINVAFTNSRSSTIPDPGTGNLTVSKTVTGIWGETNRSFLFKVMLYEAAGNGTKLAENVDGTYGQMTFTKGTALFTLRHGESLTALALPANLRYIVEERDDTGYIITSYGSTGTIPDGTTATASFVNYKGTQPRTGDETNLALWLALMGASLFVLTALPAVYVHKSKKRRAR